MFNDNIVKEFFIKKEESNGTFDWWDFINEKSDLATSLGFAKLFCPEMMEVDGCYVLKHRYHSKNFNEWKESGLTLEELESVTNMYEITDFFTTNLIVDENYSEMIDALGEVLKYFWTLTLKNRYPNIPFVVNLYEDYEYEEDGKQFASLIITIYIDRS